MTVDTVMTELDNMSICDGDNIDNNDEMEDDKNSRKQIEYEESGDNRTSDIPTIATAAAIGEDAGDNYKNNENYNIGDFNNKNIATAGEGKVWDKDNN